MTTPVNTTSLQMQWQELNKWRREANLRPYSYGFLADIARSADAVPGEPIDISYATVYAVMRGTYRAATADAIRARLLACIQVKLDDMQTSFPDSRPASVPASRKPRRTRTTPAIHRRRCSPQGYIIWQGNTYYLGSAYAGQSCTVCPLRDRSRGIRVTNASATRDAYPVDPANNQLGYEVR